MHVGRLSRLHLELTHLLLSRVSSDIDCTDVMLASSHADTNFILFYDHFFDLQIQTQGAHSQRLLSVLPILQHIS
jgi:hypothetical protein